MRPEPVSAGALIREIGRVFAHWLGAQFLICLILSMVYALGFALLHIMWWPLAAVFCGFAHAVPMFGAVAAIVIVAAVTWIGTGIGTALGAVAVFTLASALEGFYLSPKIMGRQLHISPWLVFAGGLVASSLFGFIGVLLAVPVMAIGLLIWRYFTRREAPPEDRSAPE